MTVFSPTEAVPALVVFFLRRWDSLSNPPAITHLGAGPGRWGQPVGGGEAWLQPWSCLKHCDWWSWSHSHGHPDGKINMNTWKKRQWTYYRVFHTEMMLSFALPLQAKLKEHCYFGILKFLNTTRDWSVLFFTSTRFSRLNLPICLSVTALNCCTQVVLFSMWATAAQ